MVWDTTFSLVSQIQTNTAHSLDAATGNLPGPRGRNEQILVDLSWKHVPLYEAAGSSAHFNHERLCRVGCVSFHNWQLPLHSHLRRRQSAPVIGYHTSLAHQESRSKVRCIDPGRLEFQIDPPCVQIRERLSADAEI